MTHTATGWQLITWLRERLHQSFEQPPASAPGSDVRLVFVQFGDYAEAYQRLAMPGGAENYYAQRYTIDFVSALARSPRVSSVTVVTFSRDEPLHELAPGLRTAGVNLYPKGAAARHAELTQLVESLDPTHLIVGAPIVPLLQWGLARGLPVLPLFADSFRGTGLRQQVRNARLAFVLNDPRIQVVANHNLAASLDLARIGVDESKIVPYDWPAVVTPSQNAPKQAPCDRPFRLLYVGQIMETKGVGDLLRAVRELTDTGLDVSLDVIGQVKEEVIPELAPALGIENRVRFLGMRSHVQVREAMRAADAVVVPSRHEYPEGLPMTIYEGLCSRSPLIVSDHPMFQLRIRPGQNALEFAAGEPSALAACVRELAQDPELYTRLSRNAEQAAQGYLCPLKWDRLIDAWLNPQQAEKLQRHSLRETEIAASA